MIQNPFQTPYPGQYDNHNQAHQDWLLWWLDKMEVPFSQLDEFGIGMHGKLVAHFNVLATGWQARKAKRETPKGDHMIPNKSKTPKRKPSPF